MPAGRWLQMSRRTYSQAGSMLMRVLVGMAIGGVALSTTVKMAVSLQHHRQLYEATVVAERRASSVMNELIQDISSSFILLDDFTWQEDDLHDGMVTVLSHGTAVSYRWIPALQRVYLMRGRTAGRERLADGIQTVRWRRDSLHQGGWLVVEGSVELSNTKVPVLLQHNCRSSGIHRICRRLSRYVAHPEVAFIERESA